jgi:NADH dehydrogenase
VAGLGLITLGLLVHDALTYSDIHIDRVPVSPLALHPELGGPKQLPIIKSLVGDEEDERHSKLKDKPHLVIVGGGWGAVSLLKTLRPGEYHITLVAPDTFTHFTPLLPSAAVGTVQVRSLIEPLRKLLARLSGQFMQGKAVDLVMSEQLLEVEATNAEGKPQRVYVPYDKLVIACGSVSAHHGVDGLNHAFQLKTIADAQSMRRRIIDNFEIASQPFTSEEERKRLLTFVVCGGGPTGVETAAEIYDLCQEDLMNYYPKHLREMVEIHIIQSRDHILNTYTEDISRYAEAKFARDTVNVIVNARVKKITPTSVIYSKKDADGKVVDFEVPCNFTLWSTGIAMNPFTQRVCDLLPNQVHSKAIEVDSHLRVVGSPLGTVYAVGDAATVEKRITRYILELFDEADKNKDGKLSFNEWAVMASQIKKKIPMSSIHLEKIRDLFDEFDSDKDDGLSINEIATMLDKISSKITSLPATAQVASQQGKYLGKKFNKLAKKHGNLDANNSILDQDSAVMDHFKYRHLGSLAYIGNAAVFDYEGVSVKGGLGAMYAWRSIYLSESVSMRTRALLMFDWIIRGIWGRDLSRL